MRRAVVALMVTLLLAGGAVAGGVYLIAIRANEGSETHTAICALIEDLDIRTEGTRVFLRDHPKGVPGFATASQLRETLHNQERTLAALSVVDCN